MLLNSNARIKVDAKTSSNSYGAYGVRISIDGVTFLRWQFVYRRRARRADVCAAPSSCETLIRAALAKSAKSRLPNTLITALLKHTQSNGKYKF